MASTLAHRGPDGSGYRYGKGYALGHRRLSIIDLAGGQQPLTNGDETRWVIANGEIYNFRALRAELEAAGHVFRSGSDCEVIGHGHERWGNAMLGKLDGMFAFALVDETSDTLMLVRDRLGIKPLYYAEFDGALIFASEVKAILAYPGFPRRLNRGAVTSYLNFRYVVGEQTFFEGIRQLSPGHWLRVTRQGVQARQYWDVPHEPETLQVDDETAVAEVREHLRRAVSQRMISDVPFGAYLSGGVDSSLVVALMAQQHDTAIKTYSIGFEEEGYNEFEYARLVAERYHTDHKELVLSESDYFTLMPQLIAYKDAPLGVPNEVPLWQMSQILKQDITVVLSGEGADELFGGYGRIFRAAEAFDQASSGRSVLEFFLERYGYYDAQALAAVLSPAFRNDREAHAHPTQVFQAAFDTVQDLSVARQFMWVFQKHHLPGLLQRLDTTTMATSVEGRVPFVDHHLVEYGQRLPVSQKLRWKSLAHQEQARGLSADAISEVHDTPKWVLRQAAQPFLPQSILERKKVGFPVPLGRWLGGQLTSVGKQMLLTDKCRQRGLLDVAAVEQRLNGLESASWNEGMQVWMLLSLEMFLSQYFDGA